MRFTDNHLHEEVSSLQRDLWGMQLTSSTFFRDNSGSGVASGPASRGALFVGSSDDVNENGGSANNRVVSRAASTLSTGSGNSPQKKIPVPMAISSGNSSFFGRLKAKLTSNTANESRRSPRAGGTPRRGAQFNQSERSNVSSIDDGSGFDAGPFTFRCCSAVSHCTQNLADVSRTYEQALDAIQALAAKRLEQCEQLSGQEKKLREGLICDLQNALLVIDSSHQALEALRCIYTGEIVAQKQVVEKPQGESDLSSPLRWKRLKNKPNQNASYYDPMAATNANLEILSLLSEHYKWNEDRSDSGEYTPPITPSHQQRRGGENRVESSRGGCSSIAAPPQPEGMRSGGVSPSPQLNLKFPSRTGSAHSSPFSTPREESPRTRFVNQTTRSGSRTSHPLRLAEVELVGMLFSKLSDLEEQERVNPSATRRVKRTKGGDPLRIVRLNETEIVTAIQSHLAGCLVVTPSTMLLGLAPIHDLASAAVQKDLLARQREWNPHPLVKCLVGFLMKHRSTLEGDWGKLAELASWQSSQTVNRNNQAAKQAATIFNEERMCILSELSAMWFRVTLEERGLPFALESENSVRGREMIEAILRSSEENGGDGFNGARSSLGSHRRFSSNALNESSVAAVLDCELLNTDVIPTLLDDCLEKLTMAMFLLHSPTAKKADDDFTSNCRLRAVRARRTVEQLLNKKDGTPCPVKSSIFETAVGMFAADWKKEAIMCREGTENCGATSEQERWHPLPRQVIHL